MICSYLPYKKEFVNALSVIPFKILLGTFIEVLDLSLLIMLIGSFYDHCARFGSEVP